MIEFWQRGKNFIPPKSEYKDNLRIIVCPCNVSKFCGNNADSRLAKLTGKIPVNSGKFPYLNKLIFELQFLGNGRNWIFKNSAKALHVLHLNIENSATWNKNFEMTSQAKGDKQRKNYLFWEFVICSNIKENEMLFTNRIHRMMKNGRSSPYCLRVFAFYSEQRIPDRRIRQDNLR